MEQARASYNLHGWILRDVRDIVNSFDGAFTTNVESGNEDFGKDLANLAKEQADSAIFTSFSKPPADGPWMPDTCGDQRVFVTSLALKAHVEKLSATNVLDDTERLDRVCAFIIWVNKASNRSLYDTCFATLNPNHSTP